MARYHTDITGGAAQRLLERVFIVLPVRGNYDIRSFVYRRLAQVLAGNTYHCEIDHFRKPAQGRYNRRIADEKKLWFWEMWFHIDIQDAAAGATHRKDTHVLAMLARNSHV